LRQCILRTAGRRPQMTYPDSDKALIHAVNLVLRRSPNLDYWDGESG
jgi:hypothetical protein